MQGCQRDTFSALLHFFTPGDTVPLVGEKRPLFEKKDDFGIFSKSMPYVSIFSFFLTATAFNLCFVPIQIRFRLTDFFLSYPRYFPFQKRETSNVVKHMTCSREFRKKIRKKKLKQAYNCW